MSFNCLIQKLNNPCIHYIHHMWVQNPEYHRSLWINIITFLSYLSESDKYQTNYDAYYGQYADNSVSGEAYDQSDSASEFQQHLLKYVQQYQEKQDGLSILDDPSAVSSKFSFFNGWLISWTNLVNLLILGLKLWLLLISDIMYKLNAPSYF